MAGVLFEDIFNVKDIDPEGKKFDRGECLLKRAGRFFRLCRLGEIRVVPGNLPIFTLSVKFHDGIAC